MRSAWRLPMGITRHLQPQSHGGKMRCQMGLRASCCPCASTIESTNVLIADDPAHADIIDQIKELIETRVRPAVAQDGGDIIFHGFDRGVVYLHLRGACSGCPSSIGTLKNGIENMLKHYVPEVIAVEAVA